MRIIVIQREEGEYIDGTNQYDLIEVPNGEHIATTKEIVEHTSAKDYADSKGWERVEWLR